MKKFFVVLVCMSMLFSLGTINISAAQEEPLSIEKVENTGPTLGIEKTTSDTQLLEIFNGIKDKAPTLSSDGQKIILPAIENEQYNISLYGTSNSAVIREDGKITQPLEDMIVYLYYQVENKDTKEKIASGLKVTIRQKQKIPTPACHRRRGFLFFIGDYAGLQISSRSAFAIS